MTDNKQISARTLNYDDIQGNVIRNNEAVRGGGIAGSLDADLTIVNNIIYGNSATEGGGGIKNGTDGSTFVLTNNTISDVDLLIVVACVASLLGQRHLAEVADP